MSATEFCAAKPAIVEGSAVHCPHAARLWDVSKDGRTEQLLRCEGHAAKLRAKGYVVKATAIEAKSARPKWDMTSTHSLEAGAEYLRKNSNALVVLVIRSGDAVFALADGLGEKDIPGLMDAALPDAYANLEERQEKTREKKVHQQIRNGVNPERSRVA